MNEQELTRQREKDAVMAQWVCANESHPEVKQWLVNHPPPTGWQGTPMEWAYLEMPIISAARFYDFQERLRP